MSEHRLLFIDTETGGLEPVEHSLFSLGIIVWENGRALFEDEIYIKDTVYRATAQALAINNINIDYLDKFGLDEQNVVKRIRGIKEQYFNNEILTVAGHNIAFDISFIKQLYKKGGYNFTEDFSHRTVDTASILQFLYFTGKLQKNISSSDAAFQYFNIDVKKRHTALDDCRATVCLFNELILLGN